MMKIRHLTLAMAAFSMIFASCSAGSGTASGTDGSSPSAGAVARDELRSTLAAVQQSGRVIFGHHDDPVYGHDWTGDSARSDVRETAGDYPGIMSWDLGAIELGGENNLDGVPFSRIRAEVAAQHERGGVNTFSWHLFNPVNGHDSWDVSDTTIVEKMLNDPAVMERFDRQLTAVADFLGSLTDTNGNPVPVIFRPWHENSGSWFFWGAGLCTPEQYRALWKRTRELFDSLGVDNVLWAYSPDRLSDDAQFDERYPGDSLVDIIGCDVYHFDDETGTELYIADASRSLDIISRQASARNKIAAFTETGQESITIADWYTRILLPLLKSHSVSYVVVWRNASDKPMHFYAPYKGHPAEVDFKNFYGDTTTVFANDVKKLL